MTDNTKSAEIDASGVQDLIDKLKNAGVSEGREEADRLVAEARAKAMSMIDEAREEANNLVTRAREEAEQLEASGKQALQLAGRDAILQLKEQLENEFENRLAGLIGESLTDHELVHQMILEITSGTRAGSENPTAHSDTLSIDKGAKTQLLLSAGNDAEANQKLDEFVRGLSGELFSAGVELRVVGEPDSGIRIQLAADNVEIELTKTALTKWLIRFLAPRFRSIIHPAT